MPRGVSINIGINTLDTNHYGDSFRTLNSCLKDARDMANLAKKQNFEVFKNNSLPLVGTPKANDVIKAIKSFSGKDPGSTETPLRAGDTLLVTFAGHGSQVADIRSDGTDESEEISGFDQTWCLFDRQILDDELAHLWSLFDEGVRIIFISDSCHGGTVFAMLNFISESNVTAVVTKKNTIAIAEKTKTIIKKSLITAKSINKEGGFRELTEPVFDNPVYRQVKIDLETALTARKLEPGNENATNFKDLIKARIISMTACQDNQKAKDGANSSFNGIFTAALKTIWFGTNHPLPNQPRSFTGNYESFFEKVKTETLRVNPAQEPNRIPPLGIAVPNFETGLPFTI